MQKQPACASISSGLCCVQGACHGSAGKEPGTLSGVNLSSLFVYLSAEKCKLNEELYCLQPQLVSRDALAPQALAVGRGHSTGAGSQMLIPSQEFSFLPHWGPSPSGYEGKCEQLRICLLEERVSFPSQQLSLEELDVAKPPSSSFPGWITGLCLFQGTAGCGCVPVSLSWTSPSQSSQWYQPSGDFRVPMDALYI